MTRFFILQFLLIILCQSFVFAQTSAPPADVPLWSPPLNGDDEETRQNKLNRANTICAEVTDSLRESPVEIRRNPTPILLQLYENYPDFHKDRILRILNGVNLYDRGTRGAAIRRERPTRDQAFNACVRWVSQPRRRDNPRDRRPAVIHQAEDLNAGSGEYGNEDMDQVESVADNEELAKACDELKDPECTIPQGQFDFSHMTNIMQASERMFNLTGAPVAGSGQSAGEYVAQQMLAFIGLNRTQRREIAVKACKCANQLMQNDPAKIAAVETEKAKVENAFVKRLNQKFLNDFTQQFEDISFLGRHRSSALGRNPNRLLCNDRRYFERVARGNMRCTINGVNEQERQQRIDSLFNSLGIPVTGSTVPEKLQSLQDQTKTVTISSEGLPAGAQTTYSRDEFDQIRHGMGKDNIQVVGINKIITKMMKDSSFENFAQSNSDFSPQKLFEEYIKTKDAAYISSLVGDTDPEFRTGFIANPSGYFREAAAFAGNMSPGIRQFMQNRGVYTDVREKILNARNTKSILEILDTDNDVLGEFYEDKCDEIKKNFEHLICGNPSKLMEDVDPEQLESLIRDNNSNPSNVQIDPLLGKMSFCKNKKVKLDIELDRPQSSLMLRASNQPEFFGTSMSMYAKGNEEYVKYLTGFVNRNTGNSDTARDPSFLSQTTGTTQPGVSSVPIFNRVTSDGRVDFTSNNGTFSFNQSGGLSSTTASRSIASTSSTSTYSEAASTTRGSTPEVSESGSTAPSGATFSYPATTVQAQTPANETRDSLRESLSDGSNNAQVARQIATIPDSMVDELAALRKDLEGEQKRLNEVNSTIQENQVRLLENQLKNLQEERNTIVQSTQEQPQPADDEFTVSGGSFIPASRSVAGNSSNGASQSTSVIPGNGTNVPGSPETRVSDSRIDSSTESVNRSADSANLSALVVTSNAVKTTDANLDVNQEVLRFLTANDPDLTVLNQIKDKGFVYRYKVIRNGQEVFEEVFVRFDGLSESARQALEQKIARRRSQNPALARVEDEIRNVERRHSYESLKLIMGQQVIVRQ